MRLPNLKILDKDEVTSEDIEAAEEVIIITLFNKQLYQKKKKKKKKKKYKIIKQDSNLKKK